MLSRAKRCADTGDIKGMRYIFRDSLDVDPTFEDYIEDYEYCKKVNGLFDSHMELTPLCQEERKWNLDYWNQLKKDLMKNYSLKRFEHMRTVARVVYADKVARLLVERKERQKSERPKTVQTVTRTASDAQPSKERTKVEFRDKNREEEERVEKAKKEFAEQQRKKQERIEEAQRQERENRQAEDRQRVVEQPRREVVQRNVNVRQTSTASSNDSKKWVGIVIGIAAVVIIIIIIVAL